MLSTMLASLVRPPEARMGHRRLEEVGEDAQADVNVLLIRSLEFQYEETDEVLVKKVLDA